MLSILSYPLFLMTKMQMESDQAIDSVLDHKNLKYTPLAGSSYIKLPKELDHPKNALINIQN